MRVVSLNLDHGDAAVVRRAIRKAIDGCQCGQDTEAEPCTDCQALGATLQELDRLVQRPALGRTPLLTLVAASRCLSSVPDVIATEEGSGGDRGFRLLAGDGGRGVR